MIQCKSESTKISTNGGNICICPNVWESFKINLNKNNYKYFEFVFFLIKIVLNKININSRSAKGGNPKISDIVFSLLIIHLWGV